MSRSDKIRTSDCPWINRKNQSQWRELFSGIMRTVDRLK